MQRSSRFNQAGTSIVEHLLVGLLAALLVLAALPGLLEAKDRHRLDSLVAQIETEMQFARSLAVARGQTVRVAFAQDAGGSCYVVHSGAAKACTCRSDGQAECTDDGDVHRVLSMSGSSGVQFRSSAKEIGFDSSRGTVTPTTTLRLESQGGQAVNLVVNIMGRIRTCSPVPGSTAHSPC